MMMKYWSENYTYTASTMYISHATHWLSCFSERTADEQATFPPIIDGSFALCMNAVREAMSEVYVHQYEQETTKKAPCTYQT